MEERVKNEMVLVTTAEIERINKMDDACLQQFAKAKTAQILQMVQGLSMQITMAKDKADSAKKIETGFWHWGATRKKADGVADAVVDTNKALKSLADIQQETILFVCISTRFARVMQETMAAMMANGFRDSNGNLLKLDKNTQEFAQHILASAESFVSKQAAVEVQLKTVSDVAEQNRQRLLAKDEVDSAQDEKISTNRTLIEQNTMADIQRDERIARLEKTINGLVQKPQMLLYLAIVVSCCSLLVSCVAIFLALK